MVGAMIAVLLATAVASMNSPKISLFFNNHKSCHCAEDSRKYTGIVEDCCCDYETVDSLNSQVLHPLLQEVVATPFFSIF